MTQLHAHVTQIKWGYRTISQTLGTSSQCSTNSVATMIHAFVTNRVKYYCLLAGSPKKMTA